jgi:DNA repair protein RadC
VNKEKDLHAGHRKRLRKQVINATDLSIIPEHIIMETLLSFSIARKDVNPLAHELLAHFGSLQNIFDAPKEKLLEIKGLGEVAADHIKFCALLPEIVKIKNKKGALYIKNSKDAVKILQEYIPVTRLEQFFYLCMDNNGKVILFNSIKNGNIDSISIDMRDIISHVTALPTSAVVICHTHPHGNPEPSEADCQFTNRIEKLLTELNIILCDHIILAEDDYFSFYKHGLIRKPKIITSNPLNDFIKPFNPDELA